MPLLHLGMIIVGIPYSTADMIHTETRGATPYGASTIAGAQGELQLKASRPLKGAFMSCEDHPY
jgi:NAD(P)H dehydrogenase (quinone)